MLIYRPSDVYYTLQVMANYRLKERETAKNENILAVELKKTEKKQKPIKEIVNRLYYQEVKTNTLSKAGFKDEELRMAKIREFGKKLSEAYQNAMRDLP
jgi:redox-regulated HSP33 family molecular chaperone